MNRYEKRFAELNAKNQGAFVPFTVLGDPGLEESLDIIQTMVAAGADALELGFPFSDPLADGPVIQDAMDRALKSGTNTNESLELIRRFRETEPEIPIGLLLYANVVYSYGINEFYLACKKVGVDSVLVADVPMGEAEPFWKAAIQSGIDPVFLCPPNIDESVIIEIGNKGRGYTYLLSRAGVTGTGIEAVMPVGELLKQLDVHHAPPPLLGFGISQPDHVKKAIEAGARGVIVGSAIVRIVEGYIENPGRTKEQLGDFVREMKSATSYS